jgi:L-gulonolactone oxidase
MPDVWRNWGRSVTAHPQTVGTPQSEQDVVDLVTAAARSGRTIRPVGAGHSFTPIAATDSIQMRLDRLSGILAVDATTGEVTFGAGTRLADLPALLSPHRLAMDNMGDIDRQTIAGAISTGTHGTGARFTGLAGQVTGLRVVLADATVADVDAEHRPDLFTAARLGLGAFGILTQVRLRCVPAFLLAADEHPEPLSELLADFDNRIAAVDHLEFYLFPHTDIALVKQNSRLPAWTAPRPLPRWRTLLDDEITSNGVFAVTCALGTLVPPLVPPINAVAARAVSRRSYTDRSPAVFTSPRRVRFREMEFGIDLGALPAALAQIRDLIADRGWRISFPMEIRVAAADDIPLSTAYGRPTAYIAVHRFVAEPFASYFLAVEQILLRYGGRPHWGKLHTLDAARLRPRYPLFDQVLAVRREVDPRGLFTNHYLDRVLGRAGQQ